MRLAGRQEVLLLGAGTGVVRHRQALESYIRRTRPVVVALNTQSDLDASLIDLRVACHPVRLLADCETHARLPQPLITPVSSLPTELLMSLHDKQLLDFGLGVRSGRFEVFPQGCVARTHWSSVMPWRWPPAAERDEFSWPVSMAIRRETRATRICRNCSICSVRGKACPAWFPSRRRLMTFLARVFTACSDTRTRTAARGYG